MISHFRKTPLSCDVLVAGGGISGVACALAAARQGARVILMQDRPVLGGNASSEIRMHIVGANSGRKGRDLWLETRETGIIEEIRLENSGRNAQRSPSMFDFILYDMCRAQEGLVVLLNTSVVEAETREKTVTRITAVRTSTEDAFVVDASVFVDCTGDGGLAVAAGASFLHGREDRLAFGEPLAQESADSKTLGSTLLFMGRKHDQPMPFTPPAWARKFSEEDFHLRPHATEEIDSGLEYGFWWIEWGGQLDTIKDNEEIRDELLAIVMGVWDHIKNGGDHGAEYWALDWFGAVPGKRESRRFFGQYILSEADLVESREQADAIAYGGWPIDLHPPEGVDRPDEHPSSVTQLPWLYDIPLRCCVSRDFDNLMFAGRNISATHVAFASTRVMATCGLVGEGVGVAAAHAVRNRLAPAQLAGNTEAMRDIQQRLMREDAYLIGRLYEGQGDLAFSASITASSETLEGAAGNIVSGQTRSVDGDGGIALSRRRPGAHRWISDPAKGLPAELELRWPEPVQLGEIELTFDTGLHRHLTLTQCDAYSDTMCWGSGQPECVKDYRIDLQSEGEWRTVAQVRGNWQRRRKHILNDPFSCEALRVVVEATWGVDHARIHRIVCLPPQASPSSGQ